MRGKCKLLDASINDLMQVAITLQELALAARKKAVKKQITRNAVDRLVEDLISGLVKSTWYRALCRWGKHGADHACSRRNVKLTTLLSESMAKGDFDNLKGSGKPLPERRAGAHVITDFTRHKVATNQIELLSNVRIRQTKP